MKAFCFFRLRCFRPESPHPLFLSSVPHRHKGEEAGRGIIAKKDNCRKQHADAHYFRQSSSALAIIFGSHRTGDLSAAQAPGAGIHMHRLAINDRLDPLHIGLPHAVGTPMRVADLDAVRNALIAEITLCQLPHLPGRSIQNSNRDNTRREEELQAFFSQVCRSPFG